MQLSAHFILAPAGGWLINYINRANQTHISCKTVISRLPFYQSLADLKTPLPRTTTGTSQLDYVEFKYLILVQDLWLCDVFNY